MLESLHIQNYQSYADALFEFHPGVNVIIGSSNKGKTTVLRALKWVMQNQPRGDAFRRHGTKETRCTAVIDGHTIVRVKSDKDNLYILDGKELRAFGSDVPQAIADILKLADINFQGQLDPPYLLTNSSGEVARTLNKLVKLDVIDTSLTNASKLLRSTKLEITTSENSVTRLKQDLAEYGHLPCMATDLEEADSLAAKATEIRLEADGLGRLIVRAEKAQESIDEGQGLEDLETLLGEALELRGEAESIRGTSISLDNILQTIGTYKASIKQGGARIKALQEQLPDTCPVCGGEFDNDNH